MSIQKTNQNQFSQTYNHVTQDTSEEHVMVIKRDDLFVDMTEWHGLLPNRITDFLERMYSHHLFMPREAMESDPSYKQIIPYLVFNYDDRYFLMQRKSQASEQRLKNKKTLGIGGHLRQEDVRENDVLSWALREFHEEIEYSGTLQASLLGLINDDTNAVGQVHVGVVLLIHGDSENIRVKSELKSGSLLSLDECFLHYEEFESWSKFVFLALQEKEHISHV